MNRERESMENQMRYAICASRKFKAALPGAYKTVGAFNHGLAIAASRGNRRISAAARDFAYRPVRRSPGLQLA
jgi:hypothetical protein